MSISFISSLLIGLTFNAYFSPGRIHSYVFSAANNIHTDIKVKFSSSYLSVSDGFFPRFSIIVEQVLWDSESKCYQSPLVKVDQMEIPISLSNWWRAGNAISSLSFRNTEILIRSDREDCDTNKKQVHNQLQTAGQGATPVSEQSKIIAGNKTTADKTTADTANKFNKKSYLPEVVLDDSKNKVKNIYFQNIVYRHFKHPELRANLHNLKLEIENQNPIKFDLNSQISLRMSDVSQEVPLIGSLLLHYDSDLNTIKANLFGRWREGYYVIIANCQIFESECFIENQVKQVPFSELANWVKYFEVVKVKDYAFSKAWASWLLHGRVDLKNNMNSSVEINDLSIEGELGEIKAQNIEIKKVAPLEFKPFRLVLKDLRVESIIDYLQLNYNKNNFAELGKYSGVISVQDKNHLNMIGSMNDIQVLFSNRGYSDVLKIKKLDSSIELNNNIVSLNAANVEIEDGSVSRAYLKSKFDQATTVTDFELDLDHLILPSAIQKLMTGGGSVGALRLGTNFKFSPQKILSFKGLLNVDNLNVEGLNFEKINFFVTHVEANKFQIKSTSPQAMLKSNSLVGNYLKEVLPEQEVNELGNLRLLANLTLNQEFKWETLRANVNKVETIESTGAWDRNEAVMGKLVFRKSNLVNTWKLIGTRSKPELVRQ